MWWLNTRAGEQLSLSIALITIELTSALVLSGHGELRHWSAGAPVSASAKRRDDVAGLYMVGDWALDVTELDEEFAGVLKDLGAGVEQVEILLAEEVSLELTHQAGWGP